MDCKACGAANPDDHRFCQGCGTGLARRCTGCGFECGPTARFCGGCGAPFGGAPASPPRKFAAPVAGWGELKQATVLFADIVSSTEQIANLDPEQAMDRLQPAVMAMCTAVERFGGTIIRTLGDGVMALFGVPRALEGHAALACEAALAMQRAFVADTQELRIRVGLHSGMVASDPYAPDGGKGGGAHGMTIHLASRVVATAAPGAIALTSQCRALVLQAADVQTMGFKSLKGVPEPVEIFSLGGIKPAFASQRFQHSALTPMRGRDDEIALLQHAQGQAEAGQASVIGISGAPGAGKSRLCHEFAQWCLARQVRVFQVQTQLYGHATPLQAALELIRGFVFDIQPGDGAEKARAQVARRMGAADGTGADLAIVLDFLGIAPPDAPPVQLTPSARRSRLHRILEEMFCLAGADHAVLVVEDMHWLDKASEEIVSLVGRAISRTRLLLVLNYRTAYVPPLAQQPRFQAIELAELSEADTSAMVRELVSHRRELADIYQLIVKRSGGNPFFAEELVRSLAESGILAGEPGVKKAGLGAISQSLPSTVQAVIAARIDRLAEPEKGVLQICSIVGKEIPFAVLAQVASQPAGDVESIVESLCAAELIYLQASEGALRYAFRHPLIQEVVYGAQLKARRGTLHAAVAEAMEIHFDGKLDEFAGLIAYHYDAAGESIRAADYEGRAAQWIGVTDSARAITHWQKVRALLGPVPRDAGHDRLRAMACSKIVLLGWREGLKLDELTGCLSEAMQLAPEVDSRLTQLLLFLDGRMLQANGGPADDYVRRARQALDLVDRDADVGRAATLSAALSQAYAWAGLLAQGLAANDYALRHVDAIDQFDHEFFGFSIHEWVLGIRARILTRMGRLPEAEACLAQLLLAHASSTDPVICQIAHFGYVELARERMDAALADSHAASAAAIADANQSPYLRMVSLYCAGVSRLVSRRFGQAAAAFNGALEVVRGANVAIEFETEILTNLAECYLGAMDLLNARILAAEALALTHRRTHRLLEGRVLLVMGALKVRETAADPAAAEEAGQLLDRAAELIEATGARIYVPALNAERERLAAHGRYQRTKSVTSSSP